MALGRYSTKKRAILNSIRGDKWETAYLRVTYAPGFINEGEYSNYQQLRQALDQFTEKALLQDYD